MRALQKSQAPLQLKKQVIIIAGPTASGKSALAADLADISNGCIINADSIQLYKDLSTLTTRPRGEELRRAPHKLYGILKGDARCSVARWREMALHELNLAFANHLQPIIVGGTGLYLRALVDGISPVPVIPEQILSQVHEELTNKGLEALYASLSREDPLMARKLHPHDRQRIMRALSVIRATGKSLRQWHDQNKDQVADYEYRKLLILPDRELLYQLADQRFDMMMEQGALLEVQELINKGYSDNAPIFKAVGVRELMSYLQGKISLEEATSKAKIATKHYIKRQYTWFRGQFKADFTLPYAYTRQYLPLITEQLNSNLAYRKIEV